jgi:hypothetical protein
MIECGKWVSDVNSLCYKIMPWYQLRNSIATNSTINSADVVMATELMTGNTPLVIDS